MRCKYCNAEIEQDAQFCTNCGKDLSKFNRCVNCGELLDRDTVFCPYCGTEQFKKDVIIEQIHYSSQELQQESMADTLQPDETIKSKKWIWIVVAILFLCATTGAGYYFFDKGDRNDSYVAASDTIAVDNDSAEYDIHSIDGIKARLNEIFSKALNMPDDAAVNKYFSQEFKRLYKQVENVDATFDDGPGFWNGSIWDGSQDDNPNGYEIVRVDTSSPTEAYFDINLLSNYEGRHSEQKVSMSLVFENGNWFIDDISDSQYKERMKEYVERVAQDEDSPTSFVGKVFKGSGNGGGLYTEMTISFYDDNQCTCVSDWYQAYSSPKTIKGYYEVKGNLIIVNCKEGESEHHFEFEITSNGRTLSFDHSDPEMGGTMGNDYMSLEKQ